jgi:hypothetical protein
LREEGAATGGESRFSSGCDTGEEEGDVLSIILALTAGDEGTSGGGEAMERGPTEDFFYRPCGHSRGVGFGRRNNYVTY